MKLGAPDASGRRKPEPAGGEPLTIAVRHGDRGDRAGAAPRAARARCRACKLDRGRVVVDERTMQTSNPRYFAGGDCVSGGQEVVNAVAEGKRAAAGIAASSMRCARRRWLVADLKVNLAGIQSPESVLAGVGAADQHRRPGHARVRRRLGRRGVEDARRADRQRLVALLDGRSERPAHDGAQQHRAHHRPAARRSTCARSPRSRSAIPKNARHRLADGRVQARGVARDRQGAPRTPAPTGSSSTSAVRTA